MIDYEVREGAAWLTLNRPEKLNALNREFWTDLPELLKTADTDDDVSSIVLSGRGRCFSAGADITSFSTVTSERERLAFIRTINAAMHSVEISTKPVIAAVHGYAFGGGCELTMMSDIVIADTTATFSLPEIKSGIMPGPGLVRGLSVAGMHVMKHMVLTGEPLSAADAHRVGLANTVVTKDGHLEEAQRLASVFTSFSPVALAEAKAFLGNQVPTQFDYVTSSLSFLFGTPEARSAANGFARTR